MNIFVNISSFYPTPGLGAAILNWPRDPSDMIVSILRRFSAVSADTENSDLVLFVTDEAQARSLPIEDLKSQTKASSCIAKWPNKVMLRREWPESNCLQLF